MKRLCVEVGPNQQTTISVKDQMQLAFGKCCGPKAKVMAVWLCLGRLVNRQQESMTCHQTSPRFTLDWNVATIHSCGYGIANKPGNVSLKSALHYQSILHLPLGSVAPSCTGDVSPARLLENTLVAPSDARKVTFHWDVTLVLASELLDG